MFPMIGFDDAMKILEQADPDKAADYRTVIAATERLPLLWCRNYGNLWQYITDAYKEAAVVDAVKALSEQYLAQKVHGATGGI